MGKIKVSSLVQSLWLQVGSKYVWGGRRNRVWYKKKKCYLLTSKSNVEELKKKIANESYSKARKLCGPRPGTDCSGLIISFTKCPQGNASGIGHALKNTMSVTDANIKKAGAGWVLWWDQGGTSSAGNTYSGHVGFIVSAGNSLHDSWCIHSGGGQTPSSCNCERISEGSWHKMGQLSDYIDYSENLKKIDGFYHCGGGNKAKTKYPTADKRWLPIKSNDKDYASRDFNFLSGDPVITATKNDILLRNSAKSVKKGAAALKLDTLGRYGIKDHFYSHIHNKTQFKLKQIKRIDGTWYGQIKCLYQPKRGKYPEEHYYLRNDKGIIKYPYVALTNTDFKAKIDKYCDKLIGKTIKVKEGKKTKEITIKNRNQAAKYIRIR